MAEPLRVSLVCTVRDEADNIAALLDSMLAQTRPADEIVINDCGSRDATAAIVRSYSARGHRIRLVAGGHNIASGRNNAVAHAAGPLIACTDAGLKLDPHWLERIVAPLEQGQADLVGGFYTAAPQSLFELALGATNYREVSEIDPDRFLPFGKSMAFQRDVWARVGGFPEWLDHCEDVLFDLAVREAGYRLGFVSDARVSFRPRSSLRAFARQYFLYARGDGMGGLWPLRHLIRYGVYGGVVLTLLAARRQPGLLLALLPGIAAYTRGPYRRAWERLTDREGHMPVVFHSGAAEPEKKAEPAAHAGPARPKDYTFQARVLVLALIPLIRLVGDAAKMAGYPVGLLRRARTGWRSERRRPGHAGQEPQPNAPHHVE